MVISELTRQMAWMGLEALLAASLLLALFRLRGVMGLAPIHMTLGVFYQLATLICGAVFIRMGPELIISPGSVVLFPATLFAVLFIYIREDTQEARKLIYGLTGANVVVGILGLLVAKHLQSELVFNPLGLPPEFFAQQPRLLIVGTLALLVDTVLIIILYEWLFRLFPRQLFARVYLSLAVVLVLDTLMFVTGGFWEQPHYLNILVSGIVGKVSAAVLFAAVLTIYLKRFDLPAPGASQVRLPIRDLFQVLTYREKYEQLREEAARDALTGVHNRGFLDALLPAQVAIVRRTGMPLTLLMVDLDRFKQVNDAHGHAEGDRVLRVVAATLAESTRASDFVCRYGGEEFVLLLPNTSAEEGLVFAERILAAVPESCREATVAGLARDLTVSIGLATAPPEETPEGLLESADKRLYRAKLSRNTVVAGESLPAEHAEK
jgi:diguanylate cyclase (GGDEF)-like protein